MNRESPKPIQVVYELTALRFRGYESNSRIHLGYFRTRSVAETQIEKYRGSSILGHFEIVEHEIVMIDENRFSLLKGTYPHYLEKDIYGSLCSSLCS